MSDPLSTAILSVKTALGMLKVIRESGGALKDAEVKLKLADLAGQLADAQIELAEAQTRALAKDARITELEAAFEGKDELRRVNDAMYVVDASGQPRGAAFCIRCWEVDHKRRTLVVSSIGRGMMRSCPACKASYEGNLTNSYDGEGIGL